MTKNFNDKDFEQALAEQPAPVQQEPLDDHAEKEDVESLKRQLSLQTSMCIAYKKENEQLLAANKDCINHFDALKADYDALPAQQEPVAIEHCLWARNGNTPCPHTSPPAQRTWVGLTEPEVNDCYESIMFDQNIEPSRMGVYLEIEAKLRSKNT
jgi:hypothetical protein